MYENTCGLWTPHIIRVLLWRKTGWEWENRVIRIMGADKKVKSSNYFYVHKFYTHFNRFLKIYLGSRIRCTEKMAARFTVS